MRTRWTHVTALLIAMSVGCTARRQDDVAQRGAAVMPFDLDRTTHVFETTGDGGIQQVLSDDADPDQIELIRAHLSEQAVRFARGDFHDPERIHGHHMAGMHTLVTGHERLRVSYRDIEGGGQIDYESDDAAIVDAIHQWFGAQLADHGAHARSRR